MAPRGLAVIAWVLATACGGSRRVGETNDLDVVAAVHAAPDGSVIALGGYEGIAMGPEALYHYRARIARLREGAPPQLLYDGEGEIIDASWPTARAGFALVRILRPGTPDVARSFALLVTMDGGATWQSRPVPAQDELQNVELTDERHGWITGYYGAFETNDAGASWTAVVGPRPDLEKDLVASGRDQGAIAFEEGQLEIRDRHLAIVRSARLEPGTTVECFARLSPRRLLVVTATDVPGTQDRWAAAREIDAQSFATVAVVEGLPTDFVCGSASGGQGRAFLAGARVSTGGFFGVSHVAYGYRAGSRELEKLPAGGLADAVVGLAGAPIVAWSPPGSHRVRVERWR